jgi:16S rRNA (guanine527-N7)-methyltransferase
VRATIDPGERLREGAARILGTPLTAGQEGAFRAYIGLLESWNRVHRIVGSAEPLWVVENLILDSLLFLLVLPPSFGSLLDIGSGAGIPGIPIKIVRPGSRLVMAESRRKRASFLDTAIGSIPLAGARVFHGRAESLAGEGERFDVVVARCAGDPGHVMEIGSSLVADSGRIVVTGGPGDQGTRADDTFRIVNPDTGEPRTFIVRRGRYPGLQESGFD